MGASGVSKSQVSRLCVELDERVGAFLSRPIEGEWPLDPLCGSSWLDATYVKVRQAGRIVSVAATIAVAVNTDGRREVLGMASGASEAETFWADFLRSLARRGLRGVKLVISDSHEGLKAAVARVLHASWQRCRVPSPGFMPGVPSGTDRSLFATDHAQRPGARRQGSSPPRLGLDRHRLRRSRSRSQAVAQRRRPTPSPGAQARRPDGQRRSRCAGVHDVPQGARAKINSTNPLERVNGEIKRRTDVVAIVPNEAAVTRLVGAILLEQNDKWAVQRRYMSLETLAPISDAPAVSLPAVAA